MIFYLRLAVSVDCMIKEFENFAAVSGGEVVADIETKEECINSCLLKVMLFSCCILVF